MVGIALSVTLFVLSIKVGATYTYDNGFIASVRATFLNFFYSNLPFKYTAESEPVINATLILTIILTIFNILGIAIIVKNCYNKLNNVTKDKNEGLFTPILMLLISALVLLLAIIQSNKQMDALTFLNSVVANNVSANLTLPILVLVFATLNLAVSVINKIFKNKIFIKENLNEL